MGPMFTSVPDRNIRGVVCTADRSSRRRCGPQRLSVDTDLEPHSIRAYFIRRGDHNEPVRYEVDRIRNGKSFATRRVVARQAIGAILNAESSFQRPEPPATVQTITMPRGARARTTLVDDSWSDVRSSGRSCRSTRSAARPATAPGEPSRG